MAPTLRLGEYVTAALDAEYAPQVGDIIVFHPPAGAETPTPACGNPQQGAGTSAACSTPAPQKSSWTFIKRIVAGPGGTLQIRNGA
jgi:signal peptidase I